MNIYNFDQINKLKYAQEIFKGKGLKNLTNNFFEAIKYRYIKYRAKNFQIANQNRYFTFQKQKIKYFSGSYNDAWLNERTIEIAIGKHILSSYKNKHVLEIGAVLPHYIKCNWDVLDKFEKKSGIINQDIIDFNPKQKYDLVICISTLEHIGFDDDKLDPPKMISALNHISKHCVKKNGKLVVTIPFGYNQHLDKYIANKKIKFNQMIYLKRKDIYNNWEETTWDQVKGSKYGKPYNNANAIYVGIN